jgi:phage terminase small subunit
MSLTKLQQAFVRAYMETGDATEAVRKAGYSADRAQITGCELIKNVEIQREIGRLMNARLAKVSLSSDDVIAELQNIIATCKAAGSGAWQISGRLKAAELLGRYFKMFTERVEISVDEDLIQRLEAGRKRAGLPQSEPKELPAEIIEDEPKEPVQ